MKTTYINDAQQASGYRRLLNKTFLIMTSGLLVSALIAFLVSQYLTVSTFMQNTYNVILLVAMFAQLGVATYLSVRLFKMTYQKALGMFYAYSVLTGITFSVIPMLYGIDNIFYAFGFTAVLFICCTIIGATTKVDLSKFSGLFVAGLFALIIISLVNAFVRSDSFTLLISYVGVILFLGITAWDMQKIKKFYNVYHSDEVMLDKLSIYTAFMLYLDVVNLFLYILRILGRDKKR